MKETYDILKNNSNFTIPPGWEVVPLGSKYCKSYKHSYDLLNWIKPSPFNLCLGTKIGKYWAVCIRRIRIKKVGPAIPKGYRIVNPGDIIPNEYYIIMGLKGNNDINSWKKMTLCAGDARGNYKDSIYITKIVLPVPKKYNLKLSRDQVKILGILLNNSQKTLNNWFNDSTNYYVDKSPELIEAADNEFKKAGLNENCIWNKCIKL